MAIRVKTQSQGVTTRATLSPVGINTRSNVSGGSTRKLPSKSVQTDTKINPTGTEAEFYANQAKKWAMVAEEAASRELDMVQGSETIEVIRDTDSITIATKNFVYTQATASDTWEITHNLGKRPGVIIEDSEGKRFYPPVEDIDDNTCIVHLLGATTGTAYLN